MFWRKGLKPELEQETTGWCSHCGAWALARQAWKNGQRIGRYRQQGVPIGTEQKTSVAMHFSESGAIGTAVR